MATIWGLKVAVIPWGQMSEVKMCTVRKSVHSGGVCLPVPLRNEGVPVCGCPRAIFKDIVSHPFIPVHGCLSLPVLSLSLTFHLGVIKSMSGTTQEMLNPQYPEQNCMDHPGGTLLGLGIRPTVSPKTVTLSLLQTTRAFPE